MSSLPDTPPAWHVLGAGSIGGLQALRLAGRGISVTLLGHEGDAPLRRLSLSAGPTLIESSFSQVSPSAPGPIAQLLVATKAPATRAALAPLLPFLAAGTPVVLLQNGMGVEDWLAAARPDLCVLCAITTDGVFRRDRDHLVLAGQGETVIGAARPGNAAQVAAIATELGMTAVADIRARRWRKLAINCAINPLTALGRCRNGELLERPAMLERMRTVCAEVAAVMTAEGLPAAGDELFRQACATAALTAANLSSMRSDADAGHETEILFLNGHVAAHGRAHGIATPENDRLVAEILALR